ncbi:MULTISPECIES: PBP1A family penicillin-binding protein [unclassified Burkholderia]|uniref:penicillin-binding protein 1A n=1 Tax=unclassified Burkholderia TaxID=2613784 RepID=UPI00075E24F9|nr:MULTISPECIES: PBP1A family penicillin-binding protein [unclassified Burkholderia]KVN06814.1 penicillin-binding protein [Burkholderia sp. MSMB1552]KWZ51486.1 penicillin-binding protein [Burkholderia sp. MSMB1588]
MTDHTPNPSRQTPPTPPRGPAPKRRRRYFRTLAGLVLGAAIAGGAVGAWTLHRIWTELPSVEPLAVYRPALPLRIFSRDGELLAEYGVERREFVPLERIPPLVRHALLAAEDAQFYAHGAVDIGGLARATVANVVTGQPGQGGSTITMQVARNFFLTRDKVLSRKLAEILMSYKLERAYSKDKLLELYMNEIYLGERAYGFAAAASVYFGKPLDALTPGEAAVLAGLPKAPSAFNPVVNPARATTRRDYVLGRMRALGYLDEAAYRQAVDAPVALATTPPPGILAAPYVAERARRMMVERFHDDAYTLGLDVTTTIAMRDQRAADAALARGLKLGGRRDAKDAKDALEGALVSVDAATGDILALSGGADFSHNVFDHALQAYRQPGSSFKPFVYSAALEKGMFPGVLIDDTQRTLSRDETGANPWRPRNFGNHYEGFIPVRRGLMRSKNLVAVSLMQVAQPDFVQQHAARFGFEPLRNPASLPLALGAGSATPLQVATAYGVFANGGVRMEPRLIESVRQRQGGVLFDARPPAGVRAISERNAFVMDSMLRDVVAHGTARRAVALKRADAAGKTGTSNGSKDVWFAGYSSGVVSVVWMGYDTPRSLGRATGASAALPVWVDYMKTAIDGRGAIERTPPADVALVDGDFIYAEYAGGGKCSPSLPPFVRSPFACDAARRGAADGDAPASATGAARVPTPPAVDAAERARVLELFRTED